MKLKTTKNNTAGDIKIGSFQKFKYPSTAEQYSLSDFEVRTTAVTYSELLGKSFTHDEFKHLCPRCDSEFSVPNSHGDAYQCRHCGLKRQVFGNSLFVWE